MNKKESFEKIESWLDELNDVAVNVNKIIVGNKSDLIDVKIIAEKARELASDHGAKFILASALSGRNVNEIFSTLAIGIIYYINIFLFCV